MKFSRKKKTINVAGSSISFKRTTNGVMEIWAKDIHDFVKGQGFAHAHDRFVQMDLVRIIAQGRISELLNSDESSLEIDKFMRHMSFAHETQADYENMPGHIKEFLTSYSDGVNDYLINNNPTLAYKLIGHKPEPWTPKDTLLTIKIMAYVGLAQTQQDAEKLIIQMIQGNCDIEKVKSLFTPHLDKITDTQVELIKKAKTSLHLLDKNIKFLNSLPKFVASNNWVVGPEKSMSGKVLQCNDPHLECNRLPAIWYEFVGHTDDNDFIGVNMPGIPGMVMGRNRDISYGFTYGFMDMIDYFIEEIKGHKFKDGDDFTPVETRKEVIKRKKKSEVTVNVYKTHNGYIEHGLESGDELEDGHYFARCLSGAMVNASNSANALLELLSCNNTKDFQKIATQITISCNWLCGDVNGDIGYQQSGPFPNRGEHSGLFPIEGWIKENRWQGLHTSDKLANDFNPEKGYIATANHNVNQEGKPLSLNLPMGSYRVDRINHMMEEHDKFDLNDMKRMQRDLYSTQAERFLSLFSKHITNDDIGNNFKNWERLYDKTQKGATFFEDWYFNCLRVIYGQNFIGQEAFEAIINETGILIDFYHVFDQYLLSDDESPVWFSDKSRDELVREAYDMTHKKWSCWDDVPTWGDERQVMMTNLLFDGKLPNFMGFDYGPIILEGNRATVVQGAIYNAHGRKSTFCPSYRFVTDMKEFKAYTALAGGPSAKRFSKLYTIDVPLWLNFTYKELS